MNGDEREQTRKTQENDLRVWEESEKN